VIIGGKKGKQRKRKKRYNIEKWEKNEDQEERNSRSIWDYCFNNVNKKSPKRSYGGSLGFE
jgi:hypothetical protein